jgi:hypothetical protein
MSTGPDLAALAALGGTSAHPWAGSIDPESRGLIAWVHDLVAGDRARAVAAALAACDLVAPDYPTGGDDLIAPRAYIDGMLAAVRAWLAAPTREQQEVVRSALDVTRSLHAWQGYARLHHFWVLEAVDHLCLAVWSGDQSSYIVPMDFATCAARSAACVANALVARGQAPAAAYGAVVRAVGAAT